MIPYARRMEHMAFTASVVKGLFGSMTNPDIISFSGGSPAREALPVDTIRQLADEVLQVDGRGVEALQYGPIEGVRDLREVVVRELLAPKGVTCGLENVMILTGGLEAMNLVCQAFIDPGDVILVEAPTFVQSVEIFDMFEARCVSVAMDNDGLIPEDLERKIRENRPKMIYTIPTFQNPSGRTLSLERRRAVAELAERYDVLVLEDDPYRDIRYSGEDLPPIKHFDATDRVITAGSFSKIFSPGSRLGYVVAEKDIIGQLVAVKSATNSHTSMLPQILCAEFFKRGYYPAHHRMICDLYRRRRDVMLRSIDRYFPAGTRHSDPDGGLFTWVELPGGIDTTELLRESSTDPSVNVAFVAGEGFFSDRGRPGEELYAHELRQHAGGTDRGGRPPSGRADLLQTEIKERRLKRPAPAHSAGAGLFTSVHPASGRSCPGTCPENTGPPADHSSPEPAGSEQRHPGTRCCRP